MNKLFSFIFMMFILQASVYAFVIEETDANQLDYKDGDIIIIDLRANAENLDINADFSAVDSNYDDRMVLVEENGFKYTITYTISYSNTRSDDSYTAKIDAYDPSDGTTKSVSYDIVLENQGNRQIDTEDFFVIVEDSAKINNITNVSIKNGFIQVCTSDKCQLLTEKEYEDSRNIIVNRGSVTLSGLTYDKLKDEISKETNAKLKDEMKAYLDQIVQIRDQMNQNIRSLELIITEQQNLTNYTQYQTAQIIRTGNRNNIIIAAVVIALMGLVMYTLYLRTETTWFTR